MDPSTVAILVTTAATFILNVYQSVKSRHFESSCGCCDCTYDSEHFDKANHNNDLHHHNDLNHNDLNHRHDSYADSE